jgi:hypothetical protein
VISGGLIETDLLPVALYNLEILTVGQPPQRVNAPRFQAVARAKGVEDLRMLSSQKNARSTFAIPPGTLGRFGNHVGEPVELMLVRSGPARRSGKVRVPG